MSWVKENGGPLVVGAACLGIVAGYIELRLPGVVGAEVKAQTDEKIEAIHSVSPDKIQSMEGDIADNKDYIRRTEDKLERIVDILLEE